MEDIFRRDWLEPHEWVKPIEKQWVPSGDVVHWQDEVLPISKESRLKILQLKLAKKGMSINGFGIIGFSGHYSMGVDLAKGLSQSIRVMVFKVGSTIQYIQEHLNMLERFIANNPKRYNEILQEVESANLGGPTVDEYFQRFDQQQYEFLNQYCSEDVPYALLEAPNNDCDCYITVNDNQRTVIHSHCLNRGDISPLLNKIQLINIPEKTQ